MHLSGYIVLIFRMWNNQGQIDKNEEIKFNSIIKKYNNSNHDEVKRENIEDHKLILFFQSIQNIDYWRLCIKKNKCIT